ncbi:MAG TPA: ABC transporter permease subunit, partial [Kiloniellales bacterium]|nr:ABC transporter permease subunit [Kiloniellales bacterium]
MPAGGREISVTPQLRWRRLRRSLSQAIVLGAALLALIGLGLLVRQGFAERGVSFSFDFLTKRAGFEISEGFAPTASGFAPFTSDMSNWQALAIGLFNTLKVAIVAIALATMIGVALGVSRLSGNWVVRNLAFWLTEFVRNTPLLIQLTFWYVAVVLQLPGLRDAAQFWGMIISQQGFWFPRPLVTGGAADWLALAALVAAVLAIPAGPVLRRRALAGLAVFLLALALALGFRVGLEMPEVGRFRASGGIVISPEYTALLVALTVNTAAYLGEIVRGAIEALPKGQWEAADSIGLSRRYVLGD